jgi:hypothetical protein
MTIHCERANCVAIRRRVSHAFHRSALGPSDSFVEVEDPAGLMTALAG